MKKKTNTPRLLIVLLLLFALFIISSFVALLFAIGGNDFGSSNIAVIPINGVIVSSGDASPFGASVISSVDLIKFIEESNNDNSIKAIILEINSPGGSAVASDEVGNALKKVNKTKVAVIRELGASGGYWIASNADYIIANRMSITGSIGVTSAYLGFEGLIAEHNVSYNRLVAGEFKDMGSPFKKLTNKEQILFQRKLDRIHDFFIEEVSVNRNLSEKRVRKLATGEIFLGIEAKEEGLVDELGGMDAAISFIEQKEDIKAQLRYYEKSESLWSALTKVINSQGFSIGQGFAYELTKKKESMISLR